MSAGKGGAETMANKEIVFQNWLERKNEEYKVREDRTALHHINI